MESRYKTVLYVEDEVTDTLLMRRAFSKANMAQALQTVDNGRAALDYLSGDGGFSERSQYPGPDVVLLDLNLPELHGFEVLEFIRRHRAYAALPVIIFSSSSREEDREKAKALGATDYWQKPNGIEGFASTVQKLKAGWLDVTESPEVTSGNKTPMPCSEQRSTQPFTSERKPSF